MSLERVEPKTSKRSGGVTLDLYGLNFDQPPMDIGLDDAVTTDTSTSNAVVDFLPEGRAKLTLPDELNERASIRINQIFNEVFNLEVFLELNARSLPIIDRVKLIGFSCVDTVDTAKKVKIFAEYRINKGYLLCVETWNGVSLISRDETTASIEEIESFQVRACGKSIHGYVRVRGEYLPFGKSSDLTGTSYEVELFAETPSYGVAQGGEIGLSNLRYHRMVSFVGVPANIELWEDRHIRVTTNPGEIALGDIIVSMADGSISKLDDYGRYVQGSGIFLVRRSFDTVQAIYTEHVSPSRGKLFSNTKGFIWGEDHFLSESQKNNNLAVPSLWDPITGNIPRSFFQSGTGTMKDLEYLGIERNVAEDQEQWFAKIEHGTYFIANVPYYLFSDESIIEHIGELKTEDGRSYQPLLYRPKIGIPIIASSLGEDLATGRVIERKRLQKRGKFTGKILNGVELDSTDETNIDKTKEEFIVKYNTNNEIINWKIPIDSVEVGRYIFSLPKTVLREFKIRFSRIDIFATEKTIAKKYGEAMYDSFQYGEGITEVGDYAIDYKNHRVEVILDRPYSDLGLLSYTCDYPAIVEFNSDYTEDKGTEITFPSFSNLRDLDDLGESNGRPVQRFRLYDFPIIDNSSKIIPDNSNFKLFIYDEYDNSFDTEWRRVLDVSAYGPTDKIYTVSSSDGVVLFGDGIRGQIPKKYLQILCAYKPTLKIQYEPESSNDYWLGKTVDLNLTKQNLSSGFLYISRKKLIAARVELEFSSRAINAFETTELNATVFTQEGEVVPSTTVSFEIVEGGGHFQETELITNPNGQINTIYTPSGRLEDIGIKINCYKEGPDEDTHGIEEPQVFGDENGIPYRLIRTNELIQGDISEIYLFKILDDGDQFLPYNNKTRKGGRLVLLHDGVNPVRGDYIAGRVMGFLDQLPQPFDLNAPNYDPALRGYYIIGKKTIQARAFIVQDESRIYSDIVTITVEYSPLQKGTWTLPTPPVDYESSQINTATYISI